MEAEITGDPSTDSSVGGDDGDARQRPALRQAQLVGPQCLFLVVASLVGLGSTIQAAWPGEWPVPGPGQATVLGLAVVRSWSYCAPDSEALDEIHNTQRRHAKQQCRATMLGYLDNPVVSFAGLTRLVVHDIASGVASIALRLQADAITIISPRPGDDNEDASFGSVLRSWRQVVGGGLRLLHLSSFATTLFAGTCACVHTVVLTRRCNRKAFLDPVVPSKRSLAALVEHGSQLVANLPPSVRVTHKLPKWSSQVLDPHVVIDWLEASSYLKDVRKSGEASTAFARVFSHSAPVTRSELTRDMPKISYSALRKARIKADCVAMCGGCGGNACCMSEAMVCLSSSSATAHLNEERNFSRRRWMSMTGHRFGDAFFRASPWTLR
jgi:hypothetical protein